MKWLDHFAFWRRRDRDISSDIEAHIAERIDDLVEQGMSEPEARFKASREFGNKTFYIQASRDVWWGIWLEQLLQDVRYSCRSFLQNPILVVTMILALSIGIGGNTAMFSIVRAVLLKPLPYHEADRLVHLALNYPQERIQEAPFTMSRLDPILAASRSFVEVGTFLSPQEAVSLSGKGDPEALTGARVSANFLRVLGVEPALGRSFLPEEDKRGGPPVAMISHGLWRRRFNSDPALVGKTVSLNSIPHTIIGVLPAGFAFPGSGVDVWLPRPTEWSGLEPRFWIVTPLFAFARLKPGVTLEQARAEMNTLNQQFVTANPARNDSRGGVTIRATLLKDRLVANVQTMLWMLLGAVGFVLLIACSNVATLLMSRATARVREFALRTAVGAARGRLIRQLLAETLVLAVAGGVFGVIFAKTALSAITSSGVFDLPRADEIGIDGAVLIFTIVVSLATGVFFGIFPSLQMFRVDLAGALRESGASSSGSSARTRTIGMSGRGLLVLTQVALSTVLLIGAGLMIKSLIELHAVNTGFRSAGLLTAKIALPPTSYAIPHKRAAFFAELTSQVQAVPRVTGAATVQFIPTTGVLGTNIFIKEKPTTEPNGFMGVFLQTVSPNYFRVFGIPLRRGRDFTAFDNMPGAPPVVIVNESFARRFWPTYPDGPDPIGQHIRVGAIPKAGDLEIIGIVGDVLHQDLATDARPQFFYIPTVLYPPQTAYLAIRSDGDPRRLVDDIRRRVLAIDPSQPLSDIRMMDDLLEASIGKQRLAMWLLTVFSAAALLLALIGIYAMLAYWVVQRRREIGIRRALGAQHIDIMRTILGQGLLLVMAGVICGIGGALALSRVIAGLLFRVTATDPVTFVAVPLLFVVVALAASYVPARRAALVDPLVALRNN